MSVIFISSDQKIHHSIICKNTDKFNRLENVLYNVEEYKEFLNSENYFLVRGRKINKYLSLDENGIKNNDIIMLNSMDEDYEKLFICMIIIQFNLLNLIILKKYLIFKRKNY